MKCPKCGFEQLDASAPDCAKCGILFAKWLAREREMNESLEGGGGGAPGIAAVPMGAQPVRTSGGASPFLGTLLIRVGGAACGLVILSFGLNLFGMEFILLAPLESFESPFFAKLCTIGGGLVAMVAGAALGGEFPESDED